MHDQAGAARLKRFFKITFTMVGLVLLAAGVWLYTPDKSQAELEAKYANADSEDVEEGKEDVILSEE